ncbi:MAG: AAA family ATPase, partial [Clostridia bacterium]|nr:AAA family ATPase [Clostridia bacterium]
MYNEVAKLILYSDLGENSILEELCAVFKDYDNKTCPKDELIGRIYAQIKRILDLATAYGFNKNLWHNYLTFIIIMNENSFSMT